MLHLLDEALEVFLRAEVPLPAHEYDVSFAAPDKQWATGRSARTTVNIYLRDVRRNTTLRESGLERVQVEGVDVYRPPLPLVDCRYLLTVWAQDVGDEHSTLGNLLSTLLLHVDVPAEHLPPPYAHVRPLPRLQFRSGEGGDDSDFWSALGGQLKPGLDVIVTAAVEATVTQPVGPPVDVFVMEASDLAGGRQHERELRPDPPEDVPGDGGLEL